MLDKEGVQTVFSQFRSFDLKALMLWWFESVDKDTVANLRFDTLRAFFGLSKDGAHDALVDVQQTAQVISRFLKFHRTLCRGGERFKGTMKGAA
jgi:hypothetical protein